MIKKLLTNKLFLITIIVVIILLIIKLTSTNQSSTNPPVSNQTPTPTTSQYQTNNPSVPTPTIKITEINFQIPLYNLLPYQGKYFKVIRYLKANNLELIVFNKENTDLAKQEAQDWLVKNGVDNLDSFTVVY